MRLTRRAARSCRAPPAPAGRALLVITVRKVVIGIAVLFVLFYVVTQPAQAAGAVRGATDAMFVAFESLIEFVSALFR